MDNQAMIQAMKTSISEVLEEMFFMPIDFIGSADDAMGFEENKKKVVVKLDFSGPHAGHFLLITPRSLANSITADFLGASARNLSEDQVYGTVLAMINMLAGNTLSKHDHRAVYNLQIPKLMSMDSMDAPESNASEYFDVYIETLACRMIMKLVVNI